ncbi:MAG TPA: SGNH/GDSL hydrolase family protein [Candidatus Binatia bacterium]|nr:SGNH/GDSL hydrolase family protein [Candidatus Binatia bacterium]
MAVSINKLGLRDRELERKQDQELRILLLGDSVTFGWGVPIEATFGRRLELYWPQKEGPVRTINSGVGGYNTVQEYAFLRSFVDTVEPEMVVLLYVRNDIESNDPPFELWTELDLHKRHFPMSFVSCWEKAGCIGSAYSL